MVDEGVTDTDIGLEPLKIVPSDSTPLNGPLPEAVTVNTTGVPAHTVTGPPVRLAVGRAFTVTVSLPVSPPVSAVQLASLIEAIV